MKLITWNVNSIRTRLERLLFMLSKHSPDVVCLQETKCPDDGFPSAALREAGYHAVAVGQKAYNGVAILSREPPLEARPGFAGDPCEQEARVLLARVGALRVVDVYVINGQAVGTPAYERKLAWLDALTAWLGSELARDPSPLLVCGDFNIAPDDRDVWDPELWRDKILASQPERGRFQALLSLGLSDLQRLHNQDAGIYTFWDYTAGALHRGWGLRIDLALGSPEVARRCVGVTVDRDLRKPKGGPGKPSDHAPVILEIEDV